MYGLPHMILFPCLSSDVTSGIPAGHFDLRFEVITETNRMAKRRSGRAENIVSWQLPEIVGTFQVDNNLSKAIVVPLPFRHEKRHRRAKGGMQ